MCHKTDIQSNEIDLQVAEDLAAFIKDSESLEYLNLAGCGLREKASERVVDGLMKNESVKYLML